MSNPTDTNQASEETELRDTIKPDLDFISSPGSEGRFREFDYEELLKAIQALIRTEKLKLLAEVRERVVGEDEPGVTNIMIAAEHAKQIDVLTKLEAEL